MCFVYNNKLTEGFYHDFLRALWNSELINKIALRFFALPPVWRLWLSIFMVMKYLELFTSRRFVS